MKTTLILAAFLLAGCTANTSTRQFGGTETIHLERGQHFVDAYWDNEDHLWYSTRPLLTSEEPTTYTMQEKSNYGTLQGKVLFIEAR